MSDERTIPDVLGLKLTCYPGLAINLDKVLYARAAGDKGHVQIVFEDGKELFLSPEDARDTCFATISAIKPLSSASNSTGLRG